MDSIAKGTGTLVLAALLFFIAPLLGVLAGAFSGWVVGLFFASEITGFLSRIGMDTNGLAVWQIGAALGFLGSFFRPSISTSSK